MIFDLPRRSVAPHVPTPDSVVTAALRLAGVTSGDLVLDLGCGSGRVPITAAERFGARAVGVDIDHDLLRQARSAADRGGHGDRVLFAQADLNEVEVSRASVVYLYLPEFVLDRLRPRLARELVAGARVVTYQFAVPGWLPERVETVPLQPPQSLFLYRVRSTDPMAMPDAASGACS